MKTLNRLAMFSFMLLGSLEAMAVDEPMTVDDTAFEAVTDDAASVSNLTPNIQAPNASAAAISIDVLTERKVHTTTVEASNAGVPSIDGYWVVFSGPTWTKAVITIQVTATGEIERSVNTVCLKPTGATGTFYAPFAIKDWTGSSTGTGTVTVTFWNGTILLGAANHSFTLLHHSDT